MRVAVLSDIHADFGALERVLDAVDRAGADEVWCLGDIVGLGGREPAAVVELVRERATVALAGNHDRWVTGGLPLDMLALPAHRAELRWQLSRLSADQFEWLAGLSAYEERAGNRAMARERRGSAYGVDRESVGRRHACPIALSSRVPWAVGFRGMINRVGISELEPATGSPEEVTTGRLVGVLCRRGARLAGGEEQRP
jgi:hypothetical protein